MVRSRNRWTVGLHAGGAAVAALILLGLATPTGAAASAHRRVASHAEPALCAASAVVVSARTDRHSYPPSVTVKMTSVITDVSSTSCSVWLGHDPGFSPSFIVENARDKVVWDRCWVDDRPFGCSEILYQYPLAPGQSYRDVARWDQGSTSGSAPPRRVHPGTYVFVTHYQAIATAEVSFVISRPPGP